MSHAAGPDPHAGSTTTKQSTPDVKKSDVIKIICILFVLVIILIAAGIRKNRKNEINQSKAQTEISAPKLSTPSLPAYYTEDHLLKKGEVIRVKVPSGYTFTCSGGGKMYYFQAQNSQKEIWGDGKPHTAGNSVGYFDLSCYQEEIKVICEFKKQ